MSDNTPNASIANASSEVAATPIASPKTPQTAPSAAYVADAPVLLACADQLLKGGNLHEAGMLMAKALESARTGYPVAMSGLSTMEQGVNATGNIGLQSVSPDPDMAARQLAQRGNTQIYDARHDELTKSLMANAFSPTPTPYRINESLLRMGAYCGIQDPIEATNLSFRYMNQVSKSPFVEPIIRMLSFKATRYAKMPRRPHDKGFAIRMRNAKAPVNRAAQKRIDDLSNLMLYGGFPRQADGTPSRNAKTGEPGVWDGACREKALGLHQLLQALTRASWSMDWAPYRIEFGRNKSQFPVAFFTAVDADKVLLTKEDYRPSILANSGQPIRFIEMGPDYNPLQPVAEYSWERMACVVRNPRLDYYGKGYGFAETEIAIEVLAALVTGFDFSKSYFDKNHIPPGVLSIVGNTKEISSAAVANWKSQMGRGIGAPNAFWNIVLMALQPGGGSGIQYTPLRAQSGGAQEMEMASQWMSLLIALLCSIFQVNAEEVNFPGFTGQKQSMQEADPQSKIDASEDKSIKPHMEALGASFNDNIISRIDPDFELVWVGLDDESEKGALENATARMALGSSYNEVLDRMDEPRVNVALLPQLHRTVAKKYDETDFESTLEWQEKVDAEYEKEFRKAAPDESISPWSMAPDMPMNPSMQMILSGEIQQLQGALQQGVQENLMREGGASEDDIKQMRMQQTQQDDQQGEEGQQGEGGEQGEQDGEEGQDGGGAPNGNPPNGNPQSGNPQSDPLGEGKERYDRENPFGHKNDDDEEDDDDDDDDEKENSGAKINPPRFKKSFVDPSRSPRASSRIESKYSDKLQRAAKNPANGRTGNEPRIIEVRIGRR